jgi:hypothetical protein
MRKLLVTTLFALLVCVSINSAYAYTNSRYGFSIDQPSGWTIDEPSYAAVFFYGPTVEGSRVNINIQVESTSLSLAEYVSASKTNIATVLQGFNLISEGARNRINNVDAYELVYTSTQYGSALEQKQVYLVKSGNAFVITYTALSTTYQDYLPAFEISVQTFNISDAGLDWLWIVVIVIVVAIVVAVGAIALARHRRKPPTTESPPQIQNPPTPTASLFL